LWTYSFPLTDKERSRLTKELKIIPPLLKQAKKNLTGNARDLWIAGTNNFYQQKSILEKLGAKLSKTNAELQTALNNAIKETVIFIAWLENNAQYKSGPSGVGKDNYTWYQKNVHLVPISWEEEVALLQRELDRAWSSLVLEEKKKCRSSPYGCSKNP